MSIVDTLLELAKIVDGMTDADQRAFSENAGRAIGIAIRNTPTKMDDFAAIDVIAPNARIILDAAEAEIRKVETPVPAV